jgi:hypothetical protein
MTPSLDGTAARTAGPPADAAPTRSAPIPQPGTVGELRAWYAFGVKLFGAAAPIGLVLALFGPVAFLQGLGGVALAGNLAGFALCRAGLRLESPLRRADPARPAPDLGATRPPG